MQGWKKHYPFKLSWLGIKFCLLGGKHGDTYIRMIYEINKGIISLGLTWKPEFVSLDFEMGSILAFIFCFPTIKVIGCWFHFGLCLFRKIPNQPTF